MPADDSTANWSSRNGDGHRNPHGPEPEVPALAPPVDHPALLSPPVDDPALAPASLPDTADDPALAPPAPPPDAEDAPPASAALIALPPQPRARTKPTSEIARIVAQGSTRRAATAERAKVASQLTASLPLSPRRRSTFLGGSAAVTHARGVSRSGKHGGGGRARRPTTARGDRARASAFTPSQTTDPPLQISGGSES